MRRARSEIGGEAQPGPGPYRAAAKSFDTMTAFYWSCYDTVQTLPALQRERRRGIWYWGVSLGDIQAAEGTSRRLRPA